MKDFDLNKFAKGKSRNVLQRSEVSEKLDQPVRIYLTRSEKSGLKKLAEEQHIKLSVFVRQILKNSGGI